MQKIQGTRRLLVAVISVVIIAVLVGALVYKGAIKETASHLSPGETVENNPAHFVGSQQCEGCHQSEAEHWKQSDHYHAMELPNEKSVLGDFNNTAFNYFGRKTQFTQNAGHYFVNTEDQQGKLQRFEVAYTLGYKPLQQYLVKFPDGRIQTLPFAWDTRKKSEGGQRWFHLYPHDNITPDNPLFWTRPLQNWNHMCADCHTTDFSKNFINKSNTFDSHWQETGNGCESCHGAGSAHVELMKNHPDTKINNLLINALKTQTEQMDQCGACHSRRDRLQENTAHEKMGETFRPVFIQPGLYFPDGQIQDEVFISTSFMQSKMYAAGVTCTNCHNPHTTKLKIEGNALCTQCHDKETYDTKKHHFHTENSTGAQCVSCHMPTRTYMVVDPRHDHRFSIPRPDLSKKIGSPDVCESCHHKKMQLPKMSNEQAPHFGETFWRAQHEQLFTNSASSRPENAEHSLEKIILDEKTNNIVKASALMELENYLSPSALQLIADQLRNPDAMIRLGAVESLNGAAPEQRMPLLLTVLSDSSRAVRLAIAPMLAGVDVGNTAQPGSDQQNQLQKIYSEYKSWLEANSDRGTALVNLASFYLAQGDAETAKTLFEKALQRDEKSLAAYLNYADYYRSAHDDSTAEALLRKALVIYPDSADAHYALGLLLVRTHQYPAALAELQQAQQRAPDQSQYAYVYGVGLYSSGQQERGLAVLEKAQEAFPANTQILSALVSYATERHDKVRAEKYGAKLQGLMAQ